MKFVKNEKNIRNDIAGGITRSLNKTLGQVSNAQEPDFIANLVCDLPQYIYSTLNSYAPQYQYALSGVFCHQKPIVDIGAIKKPELGDMLIAYIEETKYSVKKCNALLLQAKKTDRIPYKVPKCDAHQLKLYEEWPTFTYLRAGILNGVKRDVQPKTLNTGAQFLILNRPYKDEKQVCCAYPDKEVLLEKKLSDQIVDLLKFFSGRTFLYECNSSCKDDWTKMIWDMLRISGMSTYNRRAAGMVNEPRRVVYGEPDLLGSIDIMSDLDGSEEAVPCILIYAKERENWYQQQESRG